MLSFLDNKSTDLLFRSRNRIEFPDENYAREIMQLFTVGLTKLNNDGTPVRDENGVPVQTYTNNEITEYAKVWTGFRLQTVRGNIETKVGRKSHVPVETKSAHCIITHVIIEQEIESIQ